MIRTASNLLVAGGCPGRGGGRCHGPDAALVEGTTRRWKRAIGDNEIFQWTCIADDARHHLESRDDYVRWLANFDFSALAKSERPPAGVGVMPKWRYQAERLAHRIPYGLRHRLREKLN